VPEKASYFSNVGEEIFGEREISAGKSLPNNSLRLFRDNGMQNYSRGKPQLTAEER